VAAATPGPLRAFFLRIKDKRGKQVAAVATARRMAVLIWPLLTKQEDMPGHALPWSRRSGGSSRSRQPSRRGGNKPGPARDHCIKAIREKERAWVEQAWARFVAAWSERPKARRTGAATEQRQ
jgi:hypothetical protein